MSVEGGLIINTYWATSSPISEVSMLPYTNRLFIKYKVIKVKLFSHLLLIAIFFRVNMEMNIRAVMKYWGKRHTTSCKQFCW